jgi:hypothetical protein
LSFARTISSSPQPHFTTDRIYGILAAGRIDPIRVSS